jgi:hypothetical protein
MMGIRAARFHPEPIFVRGGRTHPVRALHGRDFTPDVVRCAS